MFEAIFLWLSITPLLTPVVPDVKRISASAFGSIVGSVVCSVRSISRKRVPEKLITSLTPFSAPSISRIIGSNSSEINTKSASPSTKRLSISSFGSILSIGITTFALQAIPKNVVTQ